eukprot:GHVS01062018.1.p1 GENE.GHVS01062018.1~~GHVS01062018.1.p1  ORF type:complete len:355 (-),score=40.74 GHVS01062018.1:1041-2105(-)
MGSSLRLLAAAGLISLTDQQRLSDCYQFYPCPPLPSQENLLLRKGFLCSVSYRTKVPNWVAEKLSSTEETPPEVQGDRSRSRFVADQDVPPMWRAKLSDYERSGYSRGHLAAAANHKHTQQDMDETFWLSSNIVPQNRFVNCTAWRVLEAFGRWLTRYYTTVYVISGPLWIPRDYFEQQVMKAEQYDAVTLTTSDADNSVKETEFRRVVVYEVLGKQLVAAPTHLFKIYMLVRPKKLLDRSSDGGKSALPDVAIAAFVVPNYRREDTRACLRQVPLRDIEVASGLDFSALRAVSMWLPSAAPNATCQELATIPKQQASNAFEAVDMCKVANPSQPKKTLCSGMLDEYLMAHAER